MQLKQALDDISTIRAQLDRVEEYRGFRSTAVGFSALASLLGCWAELGFADRISWVWIQSNTLIDPNPFLTVWISVAACSLLAALAEMIWRGVRGQRSAVWKTHRELLIQIAPSWFVGAIMTWVLVGQEVTVTTLPGLWAMIYGLGLFACRGKLPQQVKCVVGFLILGGSLFLITTFEQGPVSFLQIPPALQMALLFGGGQLALSAILYWQLERRHER